MSEQMIGQEIKEAKRPNTKTYLIILLLVIVAVLFYMFYSSGQGDMFESSQKVNSPTDAQQTSNNISTGVQGVSSTLDDISRTLGI